MTAELENTGLDAVKKTENQVFVEATPDEIVTDKNFESTYYR